MKEVFIVVESSSLEFETETIIEVCKTYEKAKEIAQELKNMAEIDIAQCIEEEYIVKEDEKFSPCDYDTTEDILEEFSVYDEEDYTQNHIDITIKRVTVKE